jgi:hypothetical protein
MICVDCNSEMSKKWHPSAKVIGGAPVVWECGVCGNQLTQADLKLLAKRQRTPAVLPEPTVTVMAD